MLATTITVPLALEDYLLVALAAGGWVYVARYVAQSAAAWGRLAFCGLTLVTLGGLSKATWKLALAAAGADVPPLNAALFVMLCPGFVALAWALWRSGEREPSAAQVWLAPVLAGAVALCAAGWLGLAKGSRAWFPLLLGLTTLCNLATAAWLIRRAWQRGLTLAAALFVGNLLITFALARMADQSVTQQWIKQGLNTLSQAAFMFAAMKLYQRERKI
jgi:hypothetical protein